MFWIHILSVYYTRFEILRFSKRKTILSDNWSNWMSLIIIKIILNKYLDLKVLSIKNKIKIKISFVN